MNLYILLSLFPGFVLSQTVQNGFIVPPPPGPAGNYTGNLAWPLDSTQTVRWVSNYTDWQLVIHQQGGTPAILTTGSNSISGQQDTTFAWDVESKLNFVSNPVFWFTLYYEGADPDNYTTSFNCHYFNITSSASSSSTILPTSSSSISQPSSSSLNPQPTSSITASSSGLSTGAKAGIAISIIVFVIAVVIAGFIYWKRSQHFKKVAVSEPQDQPPVSVPSDGTQGSHTFEYQKPELPLNEAQRYELEARG